MGQHNIRFVKRNTEFFFSFFVAHRLPFNLFIFCCFTLGEHLRRLNRKLVRSARKKSKLLWWFLPICQIIWNDVTRPLARRAWNWRAKSHWIVFYTGWTWRVIFVLPGRPWGMNPILTPSASNWTRMQQRGLTSWWLWPELPERNKSRKIAYQIFSATF